MKLQFIIVPYDSGNKDLRMGKGPQHLFNYINSFLVKDNSIEVVTLESEGLFNAEIKTSFYLYRQLAEQVKTALTEAKFPIILSGNCGSAIGTIAGINSPNTGVIWFDAHADFNTPDTTTSGFLDGMGLATIAGLCWKKIASSISGFIPVTGKQILLAGVRDHSEDENILINSAEANTVSANEIISAGIKMLTPALERLAQSCDAVYLHIDLDVINPAIAAANEYAPDGGLTKEHLLGAISMIKKFFTIKSVGIASYDPSYDKQNRFPEILKEIIKAVIQ